MAVRTTEEKVLSIADVDASHDLTPFMESASLLVDRIPEGESSDAELEMVERWLSAHFYTVYNQRVAHEQAGPVLESKQTWLGPGLQTTMYGTQAMSLDSTGTIAAINRQMVEGKKGKAAIHFLGSYANRSIEDRK